MFSKKDLLILSNLRKNARASLTTISRNTHIPISTIFDKLKLYKNNLLIKHTSLINFNKLGFDIKAIVMIKVNRNIRDNIKDYLVKHQNVNSVFKINNGFDYMFEAVFRNMREMEDFTEMLEQKFNIDSREEHYIIEDIKKESFMSDSSLIDIVI